MGTTPMTTDQTATPAPAEDHPKRVPDTPARPFLDPGEHEALYAAGFALGAPLVHDQIQLGQPYALRDENKRWLMIQNGLNGGQQYAMLGDLEGRAQNLFPITIAQATGQKVAFQLSQKSTSGSLWFLCAEDPSSSTITRAMWRPVTKDRPMVELELAVPQARRTYVVKWSNPQNNAEMFLTNYDANNPPYAAFQNSKPAPSGRDIVEDTVKDFIFDFFPVFLNNNSLGNLIKAEWPKASVDTQLYEDDYYFGVSDQRAKDVYDSSGLGGYKWRDNVFDCDDFCYVYKGQLSKDAYSRNLPMGYAAGLVFGEKVAQSGIKEAHACIIYFDPEWNVRILEPQTGEVCNGKDWDHTPYFILM